MLAAPRDYERRRLPRRLIVYGHSMLRLMKRPRGDLVRIRPILRLSSVAQSARLSTFLIRKTVVRLFNQDGLAQPGETSRFMLGGVHFRQLQKFERRRKRLSGMLHA